MRTGDDPQLAGLKHREPTVPNPCASPNSPHAPRNQRTKPAQATKRRPDSRPESPTIIHGAPVYIALTGLLLLSGTQIYPDAPAFGVGAAFLLIAVGQAVGAALIGILTDLTSQPTAFLIAAAAAAAAVILKPATTSARQASPAPS